MGGHQRIDAFAHALPPELRGTVLDRVKRPSVALRNWLSLTTLYDVDLRMRLMDEYQIDLQIVTPPSPPLETLFAGTELQEMVRLANETMSAMVDKNADRLRGVATVPLDDVDWAIEETRRCVTQLGLLGVLVYANPDVPPLDRPELEPFYRAVEDLDVPLWLHPERAKSRPDYVGEDQSRYGLHMILGWPYETSVAMARLAFTGVLRRHPRLKVIAHHAGAMVPFFANRIEMHFKPPEGSELDGSILDDFRRFYVDTVTWGSVSALMNSHELFGAGRMIFATDAPFGPDMGHSFVDSITRAVGSMPISEHERVGLWRENIVKLCGPRLA